MTDTSPCITVVFFSSYKLPKTLPVTTLLLLGPEMLLCGSFLFKLLSERFVKVSDCEHHETRPCSAPLILPLEAHESHREISPLASYETFVGGWENWHKTLHSKVSVNGVSDIITSDISVGPQTIRNKKGAAGEDSGTLSRTKIAIYFSQELVETKMELRE